MVDKNKVDLGLFSIYETTFEIEKKKNVKLNFFEMLNRSNVYFLTTPFFESEFETVFKTLGIKEKRSLVDENKKAHKALEKRTFALHKRIRTTLEKKFKAVFLRLFINIIIKAWFNVVFNSLTTSKNPGRNSAGMLKF